MTLGDRIVVMSDGKAQQVDSPLAVYRRPVNRFVASFLGTPGMNFLEGTIEPAGDGVWFTSSVAGAARIRLPDDRSAPLATQDGQRVVPGFRPAAASERAEGK